MEPCGKIHFSSLYSLFTTRYTCVLIDLANVNVCWIVGWLSVEYHITTTHCFSCFRLFDIGTWSLSSIIIITMTNTCKQFIECKNERRKKPNNNNIRNKWNYEWKWGFGMVWFDSWHDKPRLVMWLMMRIK